MTDALAVGSSLAIMCAVLALTAQGLIYRFRLTGKEAHAVRVVRNGLLVLVPATFLVCVMVGAIGVWTA